MLQTTCPTTRHHNPADRNISYTRFLMAENIKISCLGCDGVQFDRRGCLRGRNHLHLHGRPWLHTIAPQQTVCRAIPTVLPVRFNACFILIMVPLCLPAKHNTVAWFYLFLTYFYYHHMSLYIFFTPLNYISSLPNTSIVNVNCIYQFSCKSLTDSNLMRPLRNYKMHRIPCDKPTVVSKNDHCECSHLAGWSSSVFR